MKKNYNIEETRNLMAWIERNKDVTDEIDRTIILADVIYRMLYKVSLERYLANGGENTIKVEDEFFHIASSFYYLSFIFCSFFLYSSKRFFKVDIK